MTQKFEQGSLIVLILLVILAAVMVIQTVRVEKKLYDIVRITDSRTEHLKKEVSILQEKVQELEKR